MKKVFIGMLLIVALIMHGCSPKLRVAPVRTSFPGEIYVWRAPQTVNADTIKLVRIGHATTLITVGNNVILTDPWFSEKSGYKHGEPLAFSQDHLPKLSVVIISHAHYDHFDLETFKAYPDKSVPMVVPVGLGAPAREAGFRNIHEIDPWQSVFINGIKVTACPAKHGIKENTYMIEAGGRTIYFGADSELFPGLLEIKDRFPSIDLALLPVNGLSIRPLFNKQVVMDASQASEFCAMLRPSVVVPIHYNFTGGFFQDHFVLKYRSTGSEFIRRMAVVAPLTKAFLLKTGDILTIYN